MLIVSSLYVIGNSLTKFCLNSEGIASGSIYESLLLFGKTLLQIKTNGNSLFDSFTIFNSLKTVYQFASPSINMAS